MTRVAINGLGRIGRATLRILADTPALELVAVNDLTPIDDLVYLLRYDTVYGRLPETVRADDGRVVIGNREVRVLSEQDPARLPWKELDVDVVFECTGAFRHRKDLEKHVAAGAGRVVLSAPPKGGDVPSVVHGVNLLEGEPSVYSTSSCTTNCVVPVAEVMARRIGVRKALLSTVHAYTSSQGIVDSPSKQKERGRAGAANMILTTTGAASAAASILQDYEGCFDGLAIRVPVPAGSVADLTFVTAHTTSVEEINDVFRDESGQERYRGVLGVSEDPIVSSDVIGDPRASIVDLTATHVVDGDLVKVMSWYDNEWGYASQMVRQVSSLARTG
jgi:glyceraldehyde 3-phosphate dehydrogenase